MFKLIPNKQHLHEIFRKTSAPILKKYKSRDELNSEAQAKLDRIWDEKSKKNASGVDFKFIKKRYMNQLIQACFSDELYDSMSEESISFSLGGYLKMTGTILSLYYESDKRRLKSETVVYCYRYDPFNDKLSIYKEKQDPSYMVIYKDGYAYQRNYNNGIRHASLFDVFRRLEFIDGVLKTNLASTSSIDLTGDYYKRLSDSCAQTSIIKDCRKMFLEFMEGTNAHLHLTRHSPTSDLERLHSYLYWHDYVKGDYNVKNAVKIRFADKEYKTILSLVGRYSSYEGESLLKYHKHWSDINLDKTLLIEYAEYCIKRRGQLSSIGCPSLMKKPKALDDAVDILRMLYHMKSKKKISFKWSEKRIKKYHDKLVLRYNKWLTEKDSNESTDNKYIRIVEQAIEECKLPVKVLKTSAEFLIEGNEMKHCVASRWHSVKAGELVVMSSEIDERGTSGFSVVNRNSMDEAFSFYCNLGVHNRSLSEENTKNIKRIMKTANKILSQSNDRYKTNGVLVHGDQAQG